MDKEQLLAEIKNLNDTEPEPRAMTIPFRVTAAEKAMIRLAAEDINLNASEFIRTAVFQFIEELRK